MPPLDCSGPLLGGREEDQRRYQSRMSQSLHFPACGKRRVFAQMQKVQDALGAKGPVPGLHGRTLHRPSSNAACLLGGKAAQFHPVWPGESAPVCPDCSLITLCFLHIS
ncbi:uncharacterized protein BKA78DRAFT_307132 [Phyllosticta capitalensis]|uniref:uncharacterized protein n=1 Tax=Phyllosticta capitalensis TaxID=121624 RepID=UPI0031314D0A